MVLAGPFLAAWVGEEYRAAGTILVILAIAGGIDVTTWTAALVLLGIDRHRPLALIALLGAGLNLGLSIALIGSLGTTGVAVGTLVATIVEVALLSGSYITRTLALEWRSLLSAVFVPVLVPVLPSAAVAVALTRLLDPASLVSLLGICALAGAAYVGTYLSFGATASERVPRRARQESPDTETASGTLKGSCRRAMGLPPPAGYARRSPRMRSYSRPTASTIAPVVK